MLDKKGFNLWADGYDKSVKLAEASNSYPFAGYRDVLNRIYSEIKTAPNAKVLDIGLGTAVLSAKLYNEGYDISGVDFSDKMLEIARGKMPDAKLSAFDFVHGLPPEFSGQKYDFIICTYAIHHLTDERKIAFIKTLLEGNLNVGGKMLIGDVAFENLADMANCKAENAAIWDDDEFYPTQEVLGQALKKVEFEKISFCSGVFIVG